jgi:hypothetical protein
LEVNMKVVQDDLWLCVDCLSAAVNGDYTGLQYYFKEPEATRRTEAIKAGLAKLGPHLVPDFDSETGEGIREFSSCGCDCCGSGLAGTMHRFAVLGE